MGEFRNELAGILLKKVWHGKGGCKGPAPLLWFLPNKGNAKLNHRQLPGRPSAATAPAPTSWFDWTGSSKCRHLTKNTTAFAGTLNQFLPSTTKSTFQSRARFTSLENLGQAHMHQIPNQLPGAVS